ncbi:hypothetical protein ALP25_101768 [Pseudomonas syringae pv. syringae]|nr:hypothetical protein ALP25_101768 [Pseudomonas syringae pv. syringae]
MLQARQGLLLGRNRKFVLSFLPPLISQFLGCFDISGLAALVTTAQQQDQFIASLLVINTVTRANVYP